MDIFKKIYPNAGKVAILIIATIAIFTVSNPLTVSAVNEFDRWAGSVTNVDGTPLSATIRIGTIDARSNANGKFELYVPRNYKDANYVINVESHGYVPISQIHIGEAIQDMSLQMKKAQIFEINPQEDFSVRDDRGTQIAIKSGSLVDANGNPATGPLQLSVYTYDVTSEEMVGNMSGLNSAGELVSMESVGAFFAEFTDQSGNEYNLGQGSNAEISIPNDPTGNFPTTVPLWSYNTETGLWVEEGQATLQGDRYVGDVSHFSYWNFDAEKRTPACIRLTVDPLYLFENKPIKVKALLVSPTRTRYLNVVQDTNVLINLPVNTNVEFYIPTTATTPFAIINTGAPWGGTGIPSYPHDACNGSLHIDGSHKLGKLWGTKFHDVDGDGVRDTGEPGLSGWTITATDANGNSFSTVTDINGNYRLMLLPGVYSVVEVQQTGWVQTHPATTAHTVTIEAAKTTERVDFGNTDQGKLWGTKFHDVNGNGVRDSGEPGLAGWTITATDANGNSFSAVTDANGNYKLPLSPGVYSVVEVQQPGWAQTHPTTTSHTVTVEAGKTKEGVNFGNTDQGKLWGTKFHDVDGDGVRDSGEPGLAGWTITATDANGNSVSTVTNANGNYSLSLSPGVYSVVEVQQTGWTQTHPATTAHTVTVKAAKTTESVNFGNTDQGKLWGTKFHDVDGDGVRDKGEPGLVGWTITATDANGNSVSTVTNANGNYSLSLSPGVYSVVEVQQTGWTQTHPATTAHTVTVEAAKTTESVNFGNTDQGKLWGTKFHDVNGNGVRDSGEPGLAGWTITATDANGNSFSAVTDASGNYSLGLSPGVYSVVEVQQTGWTQTHPATTAHTVTVEATKTTESIDFGNTDQGKLWGTKFHDVDGNGVRDSGEPGLAGWTITATDANGNSFSAVTDANGNYSLGLSPGVYWVVEVQQPGWTQTYPTTTEHTVTVEAAKTTESVDFGNTELCKNPLDIETTNVDFLTTPVSNVSSNKNQRNNLILFAEQLDFVLPNSGIAVDITTDGTYNSSATLTPGLLTNNRVHSYLLRLDPKNRKTRTGVVKFSEKILGVIVTSRLLDASDLLGNPDVIYPKSGVSLRGIEIDNNHDSVILHPDMQTLEINLRARSPGDQIRVITAASCEEVSDPQPSTVHYFSSSTGGKVSGVSFADEDILAFDPETGRWSMYFDGSDVGLKKRDVDAFHVLDNGDILMSFNSPRTFAGVRYDDSDIVYFTPTSVGTTTKGSFKMYLDGSDVKLTTNGEDIDAIAFAPNGDLVISTLGNSRTNISAKDDDLLRLNNGVTGTNTSGTWSLYFDGSDAGFTKGAEDIWAAYIDANEVVHLSTLAGYNISSSGTNLSGDGDDVFTCTPGTLGSSTQCTFGQLWNGDDHGFGRERIDGYSAGTMPTGLIFSASVGRIGVADEVSADIDGEENDTANDDVLDDEDIKTRILLPLINR